MDVRAPLLADRAADWGADAARLHVIGHSAGGVFTQDVIDTWIEYKYTREVDPIRLRPHPYEFYLYYDA